MAAPSYPAVTSKAANRLRPGVPSLTPDHPAQGRPSPGKPEAWIRRGKEVAERRSELTPGNVSEEPGTEMWATYP